MTGYQKVMLTYYGASALALFVKDPSVSGSLAVSRGMLVGAASAYAGADIKKSLMVNAAHDVFDYALRSSVRELGPPAPHPVKSFITASLVSGLGYYAAKKIFMEE